MPDTRRDETVAPRVDLRNAAWELASALLLVPLLMLFPQVTAKSLLPTIFLAAMVPFLNHFVVTLAAGRLRLTMLAIQASALVLPVPNAAVVGLVSGIVWMRHNPTGNRYLALGTTPFRASMGAAVRVALAGNYPGAIELSGAAALITVTAHNLLSTGLSISWISDKPILFVWRRALSRTFIAAFAYFGLGGILIATVLDGTLRGYALAAIVGLLSVALIETVTEKQTREALEAEVLDHLRYVGHSRVIAGVAHNLRNDIAVARASFDEISHQPLPEDITKIVRAGAAALRRAVEKTNAMLVGATPQLDFGPHPIDLGDVARDAVAAFAVLARSKQVRIDYKPNYDPTPIKADRHLLSDAVLNLVKNGVEATPAGSAVSVSVRSHANFHLLVVDDEGPGVPRHLRDRLFEPRFTTKTDGSGLGLFSAFGIVRQHGGKLRYEDAPRGGARFTIEVPATQPYRPIRAGARPSAHESGDGLTSERQPSACRRDGDADQMSQRQAIGDGRLN